MQQTLSTDLLRRLLPQTHVLDIVRHDYPNTRAVHFIVRGLLGRGGSTNLNADQVGEAVGEFLLARQIEIPLDLLVDEHVRESAQAPAAAPL